MQYAPPLASPGVRFTGASPVNGIQPVNGWALMSIVDHDGDGFVFAEYIARGQARDVHLDVSRFRSEFTPTQDRFDWLVKSGFAARRGVAPWTNEAIDRARSAQGERLAA